MARRIASSGTLLFEFDSVDMVDVDVVYWVL